MSDLVADKLTDTQKKNLEGEISLEDKNSFEQEAHGPHRSPEKTVQINKHTYIYIIILIKRRNKIINFMTIYWFFN